MVRREGKRKKNLFLPPVMRRLIGESARAAR
jgi:hypothetical protein